jgi:hypothetical protein
VTRKKRVFNAKHGKEKINSLKCCRMQLKDTQVSVQGEGAEVLSLSKNAVHLVFAEHILSIGPYPILGSMARMVHEKIQSDSLSSQFFRGHLGLRLRSNLFTVQLKGKSGVRSRTSSEQVAFCRATRERNGSISVSLRKKRNVSLVDWSHLLSQFFKISNKFPLKGTF